MPRYSGPSLRVWVNNGWVSEPIRDDFAGEVDRFRRLFAGQRLEMVTADVVALWRPSGHDPHDRTDWSWDDEAAFVREHPAEGFADWGSFVADIAANGVREPLELGDDGAVCGGHHRICAAVELDVERLPVTFVTGCVKPPVQVVS